MCSPLCLNNSTDVVINNYLQRSDFLIDVCRSRAHKCELKIERKLPWNTFDPKIVSLSVKGFGATETMLHQYVCSHVGTLSQTNVTLKHRPWNHMGVWCCLNWYFLTSWRSDKLWNGINKNSMRERIFITTDMKKHCEKKQIYTTACVFDVLL